MMDIINPWGALRDARERMRLLSDEATSAYWEASALRSQLAEAERQRGDYYSWVHELQGQLAEGHFRNPKTGRLGRKGERFDA